MKSKFHYLFIILFLLPIVLVLLSIVMIISSESKNCNINTNDNIGQPVMNISNTVEASSIETIDEINNTLKIKNKRDITVWIDPDTGVHYLVLQQGLNGLITMVPRLNSDGTVICDKKGD